MFVKQRADRKIVQDPQFKTSTPPSIQAGSMTSQKEQEGHVTPKHGTRNGFFRRGSGPGLVLVRGAMATGFKFDGL